MDETLTILSCILLFISGIFTIVLGYFVDIRKKKKSILYLYTKKRKTHSLLDECLDKISFINKTEEKNAQKYKIINDKITPRQITKMLLLLLLFGVFLSILAQNMLLLPVMILIAIFLPQSILSLIAKNRKDKIRNQLKIAIGFLKSELISGYSIIISLQNIIPKLPMPIKSEFQLLTREINSGVTPSKALGNFAKRIDDKFAYVFSDLLSKNYEDGTDFSNALTDVSNDIAFEELEKESVKTDIITVRITNIILNGVFFISILVAFILVPKYSLCFKNTLFGQILLVVAVLNSFLSICLGLKLEK